MDSFELNKIAGALLATLLVVLGLSFASDMLFTHKKLEKPGFDIAVVEAPSGGTAAPAEPAKPIAELLATANAEKGQNVAKQCLACHTFGKGEANKVGPNLYGIVAKAKTAMAGFNYSAPLKAKGGTWSFDDLSAFLENPKAYAPGTSMSYAGVKKGTDRADVILYLRSLADSPVALPK